MNENRFTTTDLAKLPREFVALALLGTRVPQSLRVFMLSLAIVDDIGAILVIAVGYSDEIVWQALVAAAVGVAVIPAMARIGVRGVPVYLVVGG